jgi:hypothetical protein
MQTNVKNMYNRGTRSCEELKGILIYEMIVILLSWELGVHQQIRHQIPTISLNVKKLWDTL